MEMLKDLLGMAEFLGFIIGILALMWVFKKVMNWFENH